MSFKVDKQTQEDLNLLGKYTPGSVFNLFNKVQTSGGERLLQQMFQQPLTDPQAINTRSGLFKYFGQKKLLFPFSKQDFQEVENYFRIGTSSNYPGALLHVVSTRVQNYLLKDERYVKLQDGLSITIKMLNDLRSFLDALNDGGTTPFDHEKNILLGILAHPRLRNLLEQINSAKFSIMQLAAYDYLIKKTLQADMETLLENIYKLDIYIAVSAVGRDRGFTYAEAVPKAGHLIKISEVWHPALINGVANPVNFDEGSNMLFLTGANMAGKSTFMKAFGIAVYLAHMGFPVAAKSMQFSVRDGIYSSINVSDNLNMGYSHFYAEVLRVKKAAEEVATGNSFVVLFDELFKGTNVKDAYDATLAVTAAFAQYHQSFFIISTHIIEVGEALQKTSENVQFAFLPTVMHGNVPKYTYKLQSGITTDRQGMLIIENEGILALLTEK
ncbi:MutS-related protein [Mucilaginibacter aquariorum]|uniref:DNA mismatch repair protein n=1 Tax=Mucilaginibacter aquariorum TaxID=2967225 RepID=A0ABT1SXY2_9SPHI|nr:DNA mismatch repair protein [Mucilaginibacter aquariorum]MCQ6957213.1 DNA mismatch repair protein [Mucilaginibacter aquariorum]